MAPRRTQLCTFCKKHSIKIGIKDHIRNCPFKTCVCKCCQETRICQRFNRANTKNSRKPVGERTLTLPPELIDLFNFEQKILAIFKGIKKFYGDNDGKFDEAIFKWIQKGFELVNGCESTISCDIKRNNQYNSAQSVPLISNDSAANTVKQSKNFNDFSHTGDYAVYSQRNQMNDDSFYDGLTGNNFQNFGIVMENQTSFKDVLWSNATTEASCSVYHDYSVYDSFNDHLDNHETNEIFLTELKPITENLQDLPKFTTSQISSQLPTFVQTFESK